LSKEALPVIRYRTRDLTRLLPPTARSMRRMAKITGRSDDMLIVRGVNLFPSQIEELLLRVPHLAPHYLLELTREAHLDAVVIHVECKPGVAGDAAIRQHSKIELARIIKDNVGVSVMVNVRDPGALERSAGKARRVLDHRPIAS
jgi:phenylacetate-CoA ligase